MKETMTLRRILQSILRQPESHLTINPDCTPDENFQFFASEVVEQLNEHNVSPEDFAKSLGKFHACLMVIDPAPAYIPQSLPELTLLQENAKVDFTDATKWPGSFSQLYPDLEADHLFYIKTEYEDVWGETLDELILLLSDIYPNIKEYWKT
jgi:hypothetical protein